VEEYDVAVVGAGPAGSSAAAAAARAGARVVLLDRAAFPRYKTCGGGLIGPSLANLPGRPPARADITRVSLSLRMGRRWTRTSSRTCLVMATRAELDQWLLDDAIAAVAEVRAPCRVLDVADGPERATLGTDEGPITARVVIGADGTSSKVARHVGVELAHVDLGLEVELEAGRLAEQWTDRVHLDWGPLPGSYAWVFPKGNTLTVGVIAARGRADATRAYLKDFVRDQGLDRQRVVHDSGHLTRCRTPSSPLGRGRILLAGDAAGLLEPWTREGISFAVRSGALAGAVAAADAAGPAGAVRRRRRRGPRAGDDGRGAVSHGVRGSALGVPPPARAHAGRLASVRAAHRRRDHDRARGCTAAGAGGSGAGRLMGRVPAPRRARAQSNDPAADSGALIGSS